VAAFLGNAALVILKATAAIMSGSAAMLAETFHSVADTGNQLLLFLGMRLARKPADRRHPFGHGQNVYFWAFVVSMLLFTMGGAFALWEAIWKLRHPDAGDAGNTLWAYGVLAAAFVFETMSFVVALRSLVRAKADRPWHEYLRETRDPTLATVVLEDSAALVSIVIAAGGIALTEMTGVPVWDAVASGTIGLILIAVAAFLAIENHSLLLGEAASSAVQEHIRKVVTAEDTVRSIVDLRTMHVGPEAILIVLGLEFREDLRTGQIEAAIERLQRGIRGVLGPVTTDPLIAIEPARVIS
jgi:cation diffusion facilitator family transporter